jgi:hypothetical protein
MIRPTVPELTAVVMVVMIMMVMMVVVGINNDNLCAGGAGAKQAGTDDQRSNDFLHGAFLSGFG